MTPATRNLFWGGIAFAAVALAVGAVGVRTIGSDAAEPEDDDLTFSAPPGGAPEATSEVGEAGTLSFAGASYAAAPRQLTSEECVSAARRMEAQAEMWAASIEKVDGDKTVLRGQLAAAVADSREWFGAGCPPHAVLGYYEALDGSGALKSVLIDFP